MRNDLLQYSELDQVLRVLWINPNGSTAAVFNVKVTNAAPSIVPMDTLEQDIQTGSAKLLDHDIYRIVFDEATIPEKYKIIRDHAWHIVETLVQSEPNIYIRHYRGKLISKVIQKNGMQHKTLYQYLRRYWSRGQTPNALLPDYKNSGAKGKVRETNEEIKRGRPKTLGEQPGFNITKEHRKLFKLAITRYYATRRQFKLVDAYNAMIKDFFCVHMLNPESGRSIHMPAAGYEATGFPSLGQFRYWAAHDNDSIELKRNRLRPRVYDKDCRGILGTSTAESWGPGARYQIDATIADVYLVSRIDRRRIIGRPVLYIVIDVFSRMIVGMYVGLEGPSWVGAMMALANTAEDKTNFCSRNGIEISSEEWPCRHLPAILLGDRGEIEGKSINTLINNFNVSVENAAAYRADWKGVVEQRFRLIPAKFKPYVPGYIDTDYRARGSKDYRLDATLDLVQFTQIIIKCVLYYNNCHYLKSYDKDRDVAADSISPVPIDLWEWGIANRSGSLRSYPEEDVRFSLLPVDSATITLSGIRLKGLYYTCQKCLEEKWFDQARQRGSWKVKVSYDPRNLNEIYLHDQSSLHHFQVCSITERSRAYCDSSVWEIDQMQMREKHVTSVHKEKQQLSVVDLSADIEEIVSQAVAKKDNYNKESATSRTKNIRANRREEKQFNRQSEVFRFDRNRDPEISIQKSRPVSCNANIRYSDPDIIEILGNAEDGNE
jgi:hypothetical protein